MKQFPAVILIFVCSGCASINTGSSQSISVDTIPEKGAACTLANDKGSWYVPSTPGSVTVSRAYGGLTVNCEKKGYGKGIASVQSSTKGIEFGNILLGGFIGAGVDVSTGAAYDYPNLITVNLTQAQAATK